MTAKSLGFLIAMTIFLSYASAKADCNQMPSSPKVTKIAGAMARLIQSNSYVWPEVKVSSFSVLLLDKTNFPGCAVYIENGKVTSIQKNTDFPEPNNGLYGFCGGFPAFPACPLKEDSSAPTEGIIYELSNNIGPAAEMIGIEPWAIDFTTIAHEGFHFIGQALGAQKYGWWKAAGKIGVSMEGRDLINKKCYAPNAKILELTKKEISLLKDATAKAMSRANVKFIKQIVKDYFLVRNERYNNLANVIFNDDGQNRTCKEAEYSMEFMEGAAEFVGVQSAIDAGAMSESKAMEWIGLSLQRLENEGHPDELFYRTGAMALLILKKVDPASFKQVVLAITQAQMVERMVMFELFKWANQ